jgi:hypothetical protein
MDEAGELRSSVLGEQASKCARSPTELCSGHEGSAMAREHLLKGCTPSLRASRHSRTGHVPHHRQRCPEGPPRILHRRSARPPAWDLRRIRSPWPRRMGASCPVATADVGPRRRFPELLQRQWRAVGFVLHVASVRPTCYRCLTRMLQGFRADVAKVDLDVSTLWMLIPQHNV